MKLYKIKSINHFRWVDVVPSVAIVSKCPHPTAHIVLIYSQ